MIIAYAKISLFFGHSSSLKEKRQGLKSIIEKLKQRFNVSVSEIEDQDLWQKATIGVSYVALSYFQGEKTIREIRNFLDNLDYTVSDFQPDVIKT